jgi:hypothetical protein
VQKVAHKEIILLVVVAVEHVQAQMVLVKHINVHLIVLLHPKVQDLMHLFILR